jgi:hypothetical protein
MTVKNSENRFGRRGISGTELLQGRPARTYRRGRICSKADCSTILSLYNPNPRCWHHSNT